MGGDRERHSLFRTGAFQAARMRRPSIEYSGVVSPQANSGHLTFRRLLVPRALRLSTLRDPHCPAVWPVCYIPPGKLPICFDDLQMHNRM
jgi:hypothetical protein